MKTVLTKAAERKNEKLKKRKIKKLERENKNRNVKLKKKKNTFKKKWRADNNLRREK